MKSNDTRGILQKGRIVEVASKSGGGQKELEEGTEGFSEKTKARFHSKVIRRGPDECWGWLLAKNKDGYGVFGVGAHKQYAAHRVAYSIANGAIPEGQCVCHRCDNPECVNPAHLFLGTHQQNHADMMAKGRIARGVATGKNKLVEWQVLQIRSMAKTKRFTYEALARIFGVTGTLISFIVRRKIWTHLP